MSGVGRGVRTPHQCLQLRQRQITSLIRRAPRPHPLRLVLPRPLLAIITMAGNPRKHSNPTAPVAITLPLTFLPNTIPKDLLITPFSRAFIASSAYNPDFHPFYILQSTSFGFADKPSSRLIHHSTTTFHLRGLRNELFKTTRLVFSWMVELHAHLRLCTRPEAPSSLP